MSGDWYDNGIGSENCIRKCRESEQQHKVDLLESRWKLEKDNKKLKRENKRLREALTKILACDDLETSEE